MTSRAVDLSPRGAALVTGFGYLALFVFMSTNHADLVALKGLIEAGKVTPVIDRTFPLRETARALGHVGAGHAQGKTVISMTSGAVAS